MVLQGLEVPSWFGWLTGVFVWVPWGVPKFKSWLNFTTIIIITSNILTQIIWLDFFQHSRQSTKEKFLKKILLQGFNVFGVLFNAFIRLFFYTQARHIVDFLNHLEFWPVSTVPTTLQKTRRLFSILCWVSLGLRLATGIFLAIQLSLHVPQDSWFGDVGQWGYLFLMGTFGVLPLVASFYVAFSFTVVTAVYLVWIFEDYGIQIEQAIKTAKKDVPGQQKSLFQYVRMDAQMNDLVQRFDDIRGVFQLFDTIVSPLLFCLIVMSVTSLIHAANSLLIEGGSSGGWSGVASDSFNLVYQLVQLFLLQLGQDTFDRINERKVKLTRMVMLMGDGTSKFQLANIVESLCVWKWRMTAWGFFTVDRSLVSGVRILKV
ncbi:unnamed protein product [Orchesella dallaii]|uniref:Gustatory receptor n=1 Tax=Orchesella dallaii TaxID=48710 RepID=A0ABP1RR60_9HEXA